MKIIAYGHQNIRGTHKTTFEITKDKDLSTRGTCIIGVKAEYNLSLLKEFIKNVGKVKIILSVDSVSDSVIGDVNKDFDDPEEIVIRMGEFCDKRTLVNHANKSALYLKRELIEKLKNPKAKLVIEIEKTTE